MKVQRIWKREIAFRVATILERHNWRGAWRARNIFEHLDYSPPDVPVACSTTHGVDIVLEPFEDKGVERSIFTTGSYEPGTLGVIESALKQGDRFLDIGANVGLMSLVAARCVGPSGRVDSFEPLPEIRNLLSQSITLNGFNNVVLHDFALGSAPAQMTIYRHPEVNRGSASLAWSNDVGAATTVNIQPLDDIAYRDTDQPIRMIKIDVEGWELEVLRGASAVLTRHPQPVVCIEFSQTHPLHGGNHLDMFRLMTGHGYEGFCLEKSKSTLSSLQLVTESSLPQHDNIFFVPTGKVDELLSALHQKMRKFPHH